MVLVAGNFLNSVSECDQEERKEVGKYRAAADRQISSSSLWYVGYKSLADGRTDAQTFDTAYCLTGWVTVRDTKGEL